MWKIDTGEILTLAESLENLNNQLGTYVDEVQKSVKALTNSWSGASGERAVALFNSLYEGCIAGQKAAVSDYASFLKVQVSEGYEQVETANISLSEAFK